MKANLAIGLSVFILILYLTGLSTNIRAYDPYPKWFNRSGVMVKQMKVYCDTIVPTTGNGQTVDLSAAGFTSVCNAVVTAHRNTSTISQIPIVAIKSLSTTSLALNIIEPNTSLVTILGSGVLLGGAANFYSSPTSLVLHITVIGY